MMSLCTEYFYVKKTQNNTNLTVVHLDEPTITTVDQIQVRHLLAARWGYSTYKLG